MLLILFCRPLSGYLRQALWPESQVVVKWLLMNIYTWNNSVGIPPM